MKTFSTEAFDWPAILRMAEEEVATLQRGLPAPLRQRATALPVCYAERPSAGQIADGIDEDLLGLFVGVPFPETESGVVDVPAQIFIFLRNLWAYCGDEGTDLRDEIRITYLHELGHYLGLDEIDLYDRELE